MFCDLGYNSSGVISVLTFRYRYIGYRCCFLTFRYRVIGYPFKILLIIRRFGENIESGEL